MADTSTYHGKVVVITGASSGFGRGTAIELARRGAYVVLAARGEEALSEAAAECQAVGQRSIAVPTDVSDPSAVQRLAERAIEHFGRIDVWINNAGVGAIGPFHQIPLDVHDQVVRTDLLGTLYGSYQAMRHFRQNGAGTLINVASVIGKVPSPYYASYVAAKFGVVGMCDALRQELKQDGVEKIRVCTVMPAAHSTEFFDHAANYTGHKAEPIPPTYDPQVTIDALVKLVIEPQDEIFTGWQGGMFNFLHHLMPGTVEKMMAANTTKAQFQDAPPAPNTAGTVRQPSKA